MGLQIYQIGLQGTSFLNWGRSPVSPVSPAGPASQSYPLYESMASEETQCTQVLRRGEGRDRWKDQKGQATRGRARVRARGNFSGEAATSRQSNKNTTQHNTAQHKTKQPKTRLRFFVSNLNIPKYDLCAELTQHPARTPRTPLLPLLRPPYSSGAFGSTPRRPPRGRSRPQSCSVCRGTEEVRHVSSRSLFNL